MTSDIKHQKKNFRTSRILATTDPLFEPPQEVVMKVSLNEKEVFQRTILYVRVFPCHHTQISSWKFTRITRASTCCHMEATGDKLPWLEGTKYGPLTEIDFFQGK